MAVNKSGRRDGHCEFIFAFAERHGAQSLIITSKSKAYMSGFSPNGNLWELSWLKPLLQEKTRGKIWVKLLTNKVWCKERIQL